MSIKLNHNNIMKNIQIVILITIAIILPIYTGTCICQITNNDCSEINLNGFNIFDILDIMLLIGWFTLYSIYAYIGICFLIVLVLYIKNGDYKN